MPIPPLPNFTHTKILLGTRSTHIGIQRFYPLSLYPCPERGHDSHVQHITFNLEIREPSESSFVGKIHRLGANGLIVRNYPRPSESQPKEGGTLRATLHQFFIASLVFLHALAARIGFSTGKDPQGGRRGQRKTRRDLVRAGVSAILVFSTLFPSPSQYICPRRSVSV